MTDSVYLFYLGQLDVIKRTVRETPEWRVTTCSTWSRYLHCTEPVPDL
jgi:hypothetical protein